MSPIPCWWAEFTSLLLPAEDRSPKFSVSAKVVTILLSKFASSGHHLAAEISQFRQILEEAAMDYKVECHPIVQQSAERETKKRKLGKATDSPDLGGRDVESISLAELLTCSVQWMASMHKLFGRNTQTLRNLVQEARTMREQDREGFDKLRQTLLEQKLSSEQLRVPEIRNPLLELFVLLLRDVDHTKSHKPTKDELINLCVEWKCQRRNFRCLLEAPGSKAEQRRCQCSKCQEPGFCRECTCLLCDAPLSFADDQTTLRCDRWIGGASGGPGSYYDVCGHAVHAECAILHRHAGVVYSPAGEHGGSGGAGSGEGQGLGAGRGLDGEYRCSVCGAKKLLLSFWRERLLLAVENNGSPGLGKQLKLASGVLCGTRRLEYQALQERVEKAFREFEQGVDPAQVICSVKQIAEDAESLPTGPASPSGQPPLSQPECRLAGEESSSQIPPLAAQGAPLLPVSCDLNLGLPGGSLQRQLGATTEAQNTAPGTGEPSRPARCTPPKAMAGAAAAEAATPRPGGEGGLGAGSLQGAEGAGGAVGGELAAAGLPASGSGAQQQAVPGVPGAATAASAMAAASAVAATLGGSLAGFQFAIANPQAMAAIAEIAVQPQTQEAAQALLVALGSDAGLAGAVQSAVAADMAAAPELMNLARAQQRALEEAQAEVQRLTARAEADRELARTKREEAQQLEMAARRALEEATVKEMHARVSWKNVEVTKENLAKAWQAERRRFEQTKQELYTRGLERILLRLRSSVAQHLVSAGSSLAAQAAATSRQAPAGQALSAPQATGLAGLPGGHVSAAGGPLLGGQLAGEDSSLSVRPLPPLLPSLGGGATAGGGQGAPPLQGAGPRLMPSLSGATPERPAGSLSALPGCTQLQATSVGSLMGPLPLFQAPGKTGLEGPANGKRARSQRTEGSEEQPASSPNLAAATSPSPTGPGEASRCGNTAVYEEKAAAGEEGEEHSSGKKADAGEYSSAKKREEEEEGGAVSDLTEPLRRKKARGAVRLDDSFEQVDSLQGSQAEARVGNPPGGATRGSGPPLSSQLVVRVSGEELEAAEAAVIRKYFPQHAGYLGARRYKLLVIAAVARQFGTHWRISLCRRKGKGFRLQLPISGMEVARLASLEDPDTTVVAQRLAMECLGLGEGATLSPPGGYKDPIRVSEEQKDGTMHVALIHPLIARWVPSKSTNYTYEGNFVSWCRADALHPVVRDVPQKFSATFPRVLKCLELLMHNPVEGWPVAELLSANLVALDVLG